MMLALTLWALIHAAPLKQDEAVRTQPASAAESSGALAMSSTGSATDRQDCVFGGQPVICRQRPAPAAPADPAPAADPWGPPITAVDFEEPRPGPTTPDRRCFFGRRSILAPGCPDPTVRTGPAFEPAPDEALADAQGWIDDQCRDTPADAQARRRQIAEARITYVPGQWRSAETKALADENAAVAVAEAAATTRRTACRRESRQSSDGSGGAIQITCGDGDPAVLNDLMETMRGRAAGCLGPLAGEDAVTFRDRCPTRP